jgi:uncharacterized protein (UPF0262 family)
MSYHISLKDKYIYFCLVTILLSSIVGCSISKTSQCERIFQIANYVNNETKNLNYSSQKNPQEMKIWLQAADLMAKASERLTALTLEDSQLIEYQTQLAKTYHLYSQATYDAVNARETKNIEALKAARRDAEIAGKLRLKSIEGINRYCQSSQD